MILLAIPALLLGAPENKNLAWVDDQIRAIKPDRVGLTTHATARLRDPFSDMLRMNQPVIPEDPEAPDAPVTVKKAEVTRTLYLKAIMNAKTAMIDGKWYKVDDKIYGYTIKKIDRSSVVLLKKKKELKLYTASIKSNIQIQTK